jgi:hypothetical protein
MNGPLTVYQYARTALRDSLGRSIAPGITVACERVDPHWDVIEYSARIRHAGQVAWQIDDVLTQENGDLSLPWAIGYLVHYMDSQSNDHTACVVHAKLDTIGIQISADVTTELYPIIRSEWEALLHSLSMSSDEGLQ